MQPSTKYDIGDILYHRALEFYALITEISVAKWDEKTYFYKFMYLNDGGYRGEDNRVDQVDQSAYWIKVA